MGKRATKATKAVSKKRTNHKSSIASKKTKTSQVCVDIQEIVTATNTRTKLTIKKAKTRKERANIDFGQCKYTHKIMDGKFANFSGSVTKHVTVDGSPFVEFELFSNARGRPVIKQQSILVEASCIQELTSDEMLDFTNHIGGEEEDQELVQYESQTWECTKCQGRVTNDHGYCPKIVDGVVCGGTQALPKGGPIGWADCFKQVPGAVFDATSMVMCKTCLTKNDIGSSTCVACFSDPRGLPQVIPKMVDDDENDDKPMEHTDATTEGAPPQQRFVFGNTTVEIGN